MSRAFVVHHNPDNGRYEYYADATDAAASARALMKAGEGWWVAWNCHRLIRVGDLLLFKFGGARLKQEPGVYAAARVLRAPIRSGGRWILHYRQERVVTRKLINQPIVGRALARIVPRSHGASIQVVGSAGMSALRWLGQTPHDDAPTHGLVIRKEPLDKILSGTKTWEVRGTRSTRRGPIALIESKSGLVVGIAELTDVVGPLSLAELKRASRKTGFRPSRLPYDTTYAWVLENARPLTLPVPYRHPSGAVIWVMLDSRVRRRLRAEVASKSRRSRRIG
jgi:hypothetical protein